MSAAYGTTRKVAGGKRRFEEATPKPFARRPTLRTQEMRRTRATRRVFVIVLISLISAYAATLSPFLCGRRAIYLLSGPEPIRSRFCDQVRQNSTALA